ncbi:MAG: HAD family hydrolase [Armatimonadetes bacterium]|nr:HAD family hydrolase [Armatimonadota bacterium]
MNGVVFLDRDGVINEDRDDYVKNTRELKVFPFVLQSVRKLNDAGFKVIVVSNQQGVAKGLISEGDLQSIENEIVRQVSAAGGEIIAFYYCKHLASDGCSCRKPQSGLLTRAAKEHGVSLRDSFMIGDTERDILAGKRAGCKTLLVLTGSTTEQESEHIPCRPDFVAADLAAAVDYVLGVEAEVV